MDGDLLLEAHPPVDAQGQSIEPVLSKFEDLLNEVLGNTTTAVNWDIAVETLKKADGIPVLVGLQADVDAAGTGSAPPAAPAEGSAPAPGPISPGSRPHRARRRRRRPAAGSRSGPEQCADRSSSAA